MKRSAAAKTAAMHYLAVPEPASDMDITSVAPTNVDTGQYNESITGSGQQ
ncbi:MAG: hypothetical protein K0U71_01055 [Actinomycetia bacterium]|nr:hypothetical protein [Actinomycetes bacterium]